MKIIDSIKKYKWWFVFANLVVLMFIILNEFVWTSGSTRTGMIGYPWWILLVFLVVGIVVELLTKSKNYKDILIGGLFSGIYFEIILVLYNIVKVSHVIFGSEYTFGIDYGWFITNNGQWAVLLIILSIIGSIIIFELMKRKK